VKHLPNSRSIGAKISASGIKFYYIRNNIVFFFMLDNTTKITITILLMIKKLYFKLLKILIFYNDILFINDVANKENPDN
jgi:hypothetical protein